MPMMINHKLVKYALIIILIFSLITNFYLYKENKDFKNQLGSENQTTVRMTLHELSEGNTDLWIKTLREENGEVALERHIGELNQYSQIFHRMSGEMSVIGTLIDNLSNHYYQLKDSVRTGRNIEETSLEINKRKQFIEKVLFQVNSDLGDNQKLWYKELSGFDTETQRYVLEKFNEFQSQNR
jgi:hypothetical protein